MNLGATAPSCAFAGLVDLHALRALSTEEATPVVLHLSSCTECRREYQSLQAVVGELPNWPGSELQPSPFLWERVAKRIRYEAREGSQLQAAERAPDPQWEEPAPGIHCKLLATDLERNRVSMLVRLEPGVEYPPHCHAGVEELHLLDGELWIDERKLFAGDYNRAEPGTADQRVWSETGCTCVLVTSPGDVLG
jgi:anti-sigma factor ChrR (cupin superfamily)